MNNTTLNLSDLYEIVYSLHYKYLNGEDIYLIDKEKCNMAILPGDKSHAILFPYPEDIGIRVN